jgi:broad specificity phosphatase PhoE
MRKVYIVRHGETDSNAQNMGQTPDTPLSETGREQARLLSERFHNIDFDHLLVSDFARTTETAQFIVDVTKKQPEYSPLLRELKRPTQFETASYDTDEYRDYLKLIDENVSDPDWNFEDGENFFDVLDRVKKFFAKLETIEGDCVVVTHKRFITMMTMYAVIGKGFTPEVWRDSRNNIIICNTAITTILKEDGDKNWQLHTFNDHAHFAE